ncbi:lipopolysaccharide biosynthesis protein [Propionimicrobium sp. BV2F7]|uniref:lipopolysaccharide biosynthesis protein n=1 Tax=Propionimicrobium sp. BV2F7 TaxID=1111131 RepID=UPI0003D798AC|nr:membrane protein [Propionimicrobium sp. BV2F7]ETJ96718.1 putative membrane protein [Propionimicrobium sp. BV2F7]
MVRISEKKDPGPIGKSKAGGILFASAASAISSFLVTVISARTLTVEENKEFLVFWGLIFGIFGIISGTQTESTRAAATGRALDKKGDPPVGRAKIVYTALGIGLIGALLVALSSIFWSGRLTPSAPLIGTITISVGVFFYSGEMSLSGMFAGSKAWGHYSLLLAAEAVIRLVLVALAGFYLADLLGLEIASAIPSATWLLFLLGATGKNMLRKRADVSVARLVKYNLQAMLSSAAWAVLVTGFPTMLEITSDGEDPALLATLMLAVSLTRSPIMIPLQAFQGVLITWVAEANSGRMKMLLKLQVIILGVGIALSACAALIGPQLMRLLFGGAYEISSKTIGLLTLASVGMAWLVLSGATSIALNKHREYVWGWVIAACVAFFLLLVLPFDVTARSITALILSPLTGMAVHLLGIRMSDVCEGN